MFRPSKKGIKGFEAPQPHPVPSWIIFLAPCFLVPGPFAGKKTTRGSICLEPTTTTTMTMAMVMMMVMMMPTSLSPILCQISGFTLLRLHDTLAHSIEHKLWKITIIMMIFYGDDDTVTHSVEY